MNMRQVRQLLTAAGAATLVASALWAAEEPRYAEVVSRAAPLMDGSKEVDTLIEGDVVKVIRERGNWTLVEVVTTSGTRQFSIGREHLSRAADQARLEEAWLTTKLRWNVGDYSTHVVSLPGTPGETQEPDLAEGLRLAKQLYVLRRERTGEDSPETLAARYAITTIKFVNHQWDEALKEYGELLAGSVKAFGPRDRRSILMLHRVQEVALVMEKVPLTDYVAWLIQQTAYDDGLNLKDDELFNLRGREHGNDLNWLDPYYKTVPIRSDPVDMETWRHIVHDKVTDPEGSRNFFSVVDSLSKSELQQVHLAFDSIPRADDLALHFAIGHLLLRLALADEAEGLCRAAMQGCIDGSGADSVDAAEAMFLMAKFQLRREQTAAALELLKKADGVAVRANIPPHHRVLILDGMGQALLKIGQPGDAVKILQDALTLCDKDVGELHPLTISVYRDLALGLDQQGNWTEAGKHIERVVQLSRRHAFMTYEPRWLEVLDPRLNGALYLAASHPELADVSAQWAVNLKSERLKRLQSDPILKKLRVQGSLDRIPPEEFRDKPINLRSG